MKPAVAIFGGYLCLYLLLPIASFSHLRDNPDAWLYVVGNALDSANPVNRDFLLGLLLLMVAGGFVVWGQRRVPLGRWDALMALWIATPLVAGLFNPSPLVSDVFQSLYLALVWGGPYVAGRLLVRDQRELAACLRLLLTLGLISAAVGVVELLGGRFVYDLLYGFHPNQDIGTAKLIGWRPLLCFEDPNQIAMWWLTVAVVAAIVIPGWTMKWWPDGARKYTCLSLPFLFQGVGASILTVASLMGLNLRIHFEWRKTLLILAAVAGLAFVARGPLLRIARETAQQTGLERQIRGILKESPIGSAVGSFGWRLAREEEASQSIERYPWFGWGSVYFWQRDLEAAGKQRPWGFVSLVNGAYGLFGTLIVLALFFGPIVYCVFAASSLANLQLPLGLSILWAVHGIDALVNPAFLLPVLFLLGATVRWLDE